MSTGGRNLVILGVASALIALATTGVSLALYHNSGDIYLDRSRPGFLPDEEEIEDTKPEDEYSFERSGAITADVLEEYIEKLEEQVKEIDDFKLPFDVESLSDGKLGI